MSTWRESSAPEASAGGSPPQRKRLQLKPRSTVRPVDGGAPGSPGAGGSKSNPFGAAKPREEVLASKGIDPSTIDSRIAKKAVIARFTKTQEEDIEEVRRELTTVEADLRQANEMELPEAEFRQKAEAKRKELNDMMARFTKENEEAAAAKSASEDGERKFERPSERRRRLEQQDNQRGGGGGHHDEGNFSSFSGGRHRNDNDDGRF